MKSNKLSEALASLQYNEEEVNALVLKIEFHRELAEALSLDSTSKSDFILNDSQREKVHAVNGGADRRESLKLAARTHKEFLDRYVREFQTRFPEIDYQEIFDKNMDWMMDEIATKMEPLEDPVLKAK